MIRDAVNFAGLISSRTAEKTATQIMQITCLYYQICFFQAPDWSVVTFLIAGNTKLEHLYDFYI